MSYLVFSHQARAEVSGVRLQPEGRFMVPLSALDSKRLWSHGGEARARQGGSWGELPGSTWDHLYPHGPLGRWTGLGVKNRTVPQVLGKQLPPRECSEYSHQPGWLLPMAKSTVAYFRGAKSLRQCIKWRAYHSCLRLRRS